MMECYSCKAIIPSCSEKCGNVHATLAALVRTGQFSDRQIAYFELSLTEAITNAIIHGNCSDPTKFVTILFGITPDELVLVVEDEGEGFDPSKVPDPRLPEYLGKVHGRGLCLMREIMTDMSYNDRGNRLTLRLAR